MNPDVLKYAQDILDSISTIDFHYQQFQQSHNTLQILLLWMLLKEDYLL